MKDEVKKEVGSPNQKIAFLNQLIGSLEQAEEKMEKAYARENHEQFKIMRDFILKVQKRISETIK
jgi:hypothetical protein